MTYNHELIEAKWQKYWLDNKTFATDTADFSKPKYYVLDMFPYPSGQGLHVGHPEGYTATDIIARARRMQGFNVLHPMGWDAFGLPAEQYAVETGHEPASFTKSNIDHFRAQIRALGLSYDWDREFATTDPDYYRWTQWIFLKLYEKGLAYVAELPVNWCPELGTVLANEEVIDGKSERGGYPVVRKPMRQWVLRITAYAQRLLDDLELVDWPQSTKEMQTNWIGKSEGAEVVFRIDGTDREFTVFTTRCDTLFGATYCVMAPEHPFVDQITTPDRRADVQAYKKLCATKSDLERTDLNKEKTGVFTGAYAVNPVNGAKLPIWISDYVLATYGTGAIMAVPAHDERDYAFATKFGLRIIEVLKGGDGTKQAYVGDGPHVNSGFLDGMDKPTAIKAMLAWLAAHGCGQAKVQYKLRDWLFSRQRYWGEPIPIVTMDDGTLRAVPTDELPLQLPATDNYKPTHDGQSPLAHCTDWVNVTIDGQHGRRETNTMPQWAGSCWYYLRFIDPHNDKCFADPKLLAHWLPVDLYVGGAEHAVLHLLYARFWHKVLYDCGLVPTKEPFGKLFHQGMILGQAYKDPRGVLIPIDEVSFVESTPYDKAGQKLTPIIAKMSKSLRNVVNPDDIVHSHGADALRLYEMFMGPLAEAKPWSTAGIDGTRRWLDRVWRLVAESGKVTSQANPALARSYHTMVRKVTADIDGLAFNTAISQMMVFINDCYAADHLPQEYAEGFVKCFSAFAPHMGEELWQLLGHQGTIAYQPWPQYDEKYLVADQVEVVVQVNGKLRGRLSAAPDTAQDVLQAQALALPAVAKQLEGHQLRKVIFIKNKILNLVVA